jgi:succinoglycan biosynthesis protein ExoL
MHGSINARVEDIAPTTDEASSDIPTSPRARSAVLAYFCPDVTDASTLKRVQQFIDHGYRVNVFAFRRSRYNTDYQPPWPNVPLGFTSDGRYWQRLWALLRAVPVLLAHRHSVSQATAFYARNIDQLILTLLVRLFTGSRAPIAYEVLDIPPILVRRSPPAMLVRAIERLCLRHIHVLVVSSPAFHRNYFVAVQKYRGAWFLLENKLHPSISSTPLPARLATAHGRPWVVGYFGLIRGEATVALIARLAERLRGKVTFKFRGILTTVDQATFDSVLGRNPNIVYGGPYVPQQDLPDLYGGVDFAWALDLEHVDHNSRWLMPCRFYEAGYFGVPCLAVHGFEVGRAIEAQRLGWTFREPLEDSLVDFFEKLTAVDYEFVRARLTAVPRSMFVAGEDVGGLCRMLESARV